MQLLHRFEFVHKLGYVHCDLKPDNFLIGRGEHANKIFLIDFGLARQVYDPITGHIVYTPHKYLRGVYMRDDAEHIQIKR
jgi:serine/threonine protein kinase